MITVKKLKELLSDYPDNLEVILPDGSSISHIGTCIEKGKETKVILAHSKYDRFDYK